MARADRVLIVDPHPIVRGVVRTACEAAGRLTVVAEAADLDEALAACAEDEPDLLVIDPDLPGARGFEGVTALRTARPRARILVLASNVTGALVLDCLRAKADGCIDKGAGVGPIAEAIETVAGGGRVFPPGYERDAVAVAKRVGAHLEAPFEIEAMEVAVRASIGISLGQTPDARPEDLMRDADVAMYEAKGRGKGGFQVFELHMRRAVVKRMELKADLRGLRVDGDPLQVEVGYGTCGDESRYFARAEGPLPRRPAAIPLRSPM